MAYQAGDTILDNEYLAFVTNSSDPYGYNHFAGTGATVYGLGQTAIATVTAGDAITAAQWNSLWTSMDNVATHTGVSLTSTAAVSTGDTISIKAALITDLAALATAVAEGSTSALTTQSAVQNSDSGTRWQVNHTVIQTVTFSNANEARWFFNSGGRIRLNIDRTGNGAQDGGATGKDTSIDELIAAMGDFDLRSVDSELSNTSGTETTTGSDLTIGFHDLTTSYQDILVLTQNSGSYSANQTITVSAKRNVDATIVYMQTVIADLETGGDAASGQDFTYNTGNDGTNAVPDVDEFENYIGTTRVKISSMDPDSGNGLSTVFTPSAIAVTGGETANSSS